jgi:hypothetical protein
MAENKTAPNDSDPLEFIAGLDDPRRRTESLELLELFRERTGEEPVMWGDSIIGFGSYDYRYASGRSGTWMRVGFSPRKQQMTVYVMPGFDRYEDLLIALGPHSTGKSCLYLKRLDGVDMGVLGELVAESYEAMGDD